MSILGGTIVRRRRQARMVSVAPISETELPPPSHVYFGSLETSMLEVDGSRDVKRLKPELEGQEGPHYRHKLLTEEWPEAPMS